MRLLFICTANIHRSPTAEHLFTSSRNYVAASAGVSPLATRPVTAQLLEWADLVLVMDEETDKQRTVLLRQFPEVECLAEKIEVLDIPDVYRYGDPELVKVLLHKLSRLLPELDIVL
jgi:predicted protein tyrosine phosphatase